MSGASDRTALAAARSEGNGKTTRLKVEGMDCASCAQKVDTALRRIAGVEDVNVAVTTGVVRVAHAANVPEEKLAKAIKGLGYEVVPTSPPARKTTRLKVEGMDCASCAQKVDTALRRIEGVEDVNVTVTTGAVRVAHAANVPEAKLAQAIKGLGYDVVPTAPAARRNDHAGHDHTGHAHAGHAHAGHDHAAHDHAGDDHSGHDHADHSHAGHGHAHDESSADGRPWWRTRKAMLTIACGIALAVAYAIGWLVPAIESYAFIAAIAVGLVPIARRAIAAARSGSPFTIESLMTVAAAGAVIIGQTEEAAVVVLLFLIGELLEGVAAGRARASIRALAALVPKTALLERAGSGTQEVPAERLVVGDVILVRPGDRVPADGTIISGESGIDEAPVTGESVPKQKREGDAVFAGTVNLDAVLRVTVTAAAEDNTIARVVRLVEEAQESKAPTERFIDRFARYYTPAVFVLGFLVAIVPPLLFGAPWYEWIYRGLAILLIGCPCALVISTPAAIAAGLSAGARRGLLMKGGAVLEGMGRITLAAFDKTGTLTSGKPQVTDVVALGRSEIEVLALAAALETGSSHPLAQAILRRAEEEKVAIPPATNLRAVPGKGVSGEAADARLYLGSPRSAGEMASLPADVTARIDALNGEGKSVSVLVVDGQAAGLIALRDEPRPDAKAGIEALRRLGISSIMVTGDNARTAASIGATLGIDPRAELMPEHKQAIVREMQARGEKVAKIGDGINDAPGLAAADVGIAMGGGTDVALETADAAVLHGRVMDVAHMVALSRSVMRNIGQNVTVALGLKAVFLVTTILGITGLWPAILADTGATVLVTMNALRLLSTRFSA